MKTLVMVVLVLAAGCKKKEAAAVATGSATASAPVEGSAVGQVSDADCSDEHHFKLDACVAQCDAGKGTGCYVAGQAWLVGDQVPDADEAKARGYFTKGCELNNAFACKWLAPMYANGLGGLTADAKKADELTAKAIALYAPLCDKADAQACYDLSAIAKDPQQKKEAAKRACEMGKQTACEAAN
jgi:TPR repeat protein